MMKSVPALMKWTAGGLILFVLVMLVWTKLSESQDIVDAFLATNATLSRRHTTAVVSQETLSSLYAWSETEVREPRGVDNVSTYEPPVDPTSGYTVIVDVNGRRTHYFNQRDEPWASQIYGNHIGASTYYTAGCGPTSLAIVLSSLGIQGIDPKVIGDQFVEQGSRTENNGTWHTAFSHGSSMQKFGYRSEVINTGSATYESFKTAVETALREGKYIIVILGGSGQAIFNGDGHFVVVRNITDTGMILIADPVKQNINGMEFTVRQLWNNVKKTSHGATIIWR
jgi:predicted double-glycine peptidase